MLAFSFFRLAAICQGVYKRALDGNASNPERAKNVRTRRSALLSGLAVRLIDEDAIGMGRFDGKIVLVTGAAGGFGRRTAERFAADGARLVLSDLDGGRLDALAVSLGAGDGRTCRRRFRRDICPKRWSRSALERFGRLDIAINNAGIVQGFVQACRTSRPRRRARSSPSTCLASSTP